MPWHRRLKDTLFPTRMNAELDDELAFHIEQRMAELIREGMPAVDARREAARMFGNRTALQERTRGRDTVEWLADVMQDWRVAGRTLRKSPGFAVVSILTLALGVGAVTAVFTVVNGVLLRGLPYTDPERLVTVWEANPAFPGGVRFSPGNYLDLREQNRSFSQVGGFAFDKFNLTGRGSPMRISAGLVSASLFPMMGVAPMLGRGFEPGDDQWSAEVVAILSHSLWQERFGGDRGVIGTSIRLDGITCRIIGVMPPGVPVLPIKGEAQDGVDLWMALERTRDPETMHWRFSYYVAVMARLRPGVTAAAAQRDVDAMVKGIQRRWPDNIGRGAVVTPLHERTVGSARRPLTILLCAVALVLLIACANVANLNLGRGASRQREIAMRLALGASRWRVARQLLVESLVISAVGAGLGLCLAIWGVSALLKLAPPELPRAENVHVDGWVLGFTFAASACSAICFGLFPAWSVTRGDVQQGLREAGRSSSAGPRGARVRNVLVVAEIGMAMVLLTGAGLTIESFRRLLAVDPGFRPRDLITMRVPLSETKYRGIEQQAGFYAQLLERVRAIPGVKSVAAIDGPPFADGGFDNEFWIEGRPTIPGQGLSADIRRVDSGYFQTMGIPIVQGRATAETDRTDGPDVAVISQSMAAHYWPHESAIGKRLGVMFGRPNPKPTIVGVAGDVHGALDNHPRDIIYLPYPQGRHVTDMCLVMRAAAADTREVARMVQAAATSLDVNQPVYRVRRMEELMAASVATRYFEMLLLSVFAGVAMCLAAVGLYGILAYSVEVRTREIGIRTAVGASPRQVFGMVVSDACRLAAIGVATGWAGALVLTRSLAALLFEVKPGDQAAYVVVGALLWIVALAATYVPARRAMRVEPTIALRAD